MNTTEKNKIIEEIEENDDFNFIGCFYDTARLSVKLFLNCFDCIGYVVFINNESNEVTKIIPLENGLFCDVCDMCDENGNLKSKYIINA